MKYPTYTLGAAVNHGFFTPGKSYPCFRMTEKGNGGERGFFMDDTGCVRMAPAEAFSADGGVWVPPAPGCKLTGAECNVLAKRWGVTSMTVRNWHLPESDSYQPIRFVDAYRGSKLELCTEPMTPHELKSFVQARGFYLQEIAARWDTQQFGDWVKRKAAEQPALFWDLWRGMMDE